MRKIAIYFSLVVIIILCLQGIKILFFENNAGLNSIDNINAFEKNSLREAMFYEKLENKAVNCTLCFRKCNIPEGERGACRVRENQKGILYSLVYNRPSSIVPDPVEKEPMHHFLPGSLMLCIGSAGCNYRCRYCHNWQLSQRRPEDLRYYSLRPEQIVMYAVQNDIPSISFTYNEPTVLFEYMYDTAKIARENNIRVIFHSNGAISPGPLRKLLPYIDAVTIDLKGFCDNYYREIADAELNIVLENLKIIKGSGVWLEIVNLLVPGMNDDEESIRAMCKWIREELGPDVPLHFSRFFPNYRLLEIPPTPVSVLERAHKTARQEGINHVSIGNVPGHKYNSTYCSKCDSVLILRSHFTVLENNIRNDKCNKCNEHVPGIWN